MFDKFTTVSPHNNAPVRCSRRQWSGHIVANHPEMAGHEDAVERTIREPLAVYRSDVDRRRHVFYRPLRLPPPLDLGYLRVVVEYSGESSGRLRGWVVTAFPVIGPKKGEVLIWPER